MKCDNWEDEKDTKQSPIRKREGGLGKRSNYLVQIKLRMRRNESVDVMYIHNVMAN